MLTPVDKHRNLLRVLTYHRVAAMGETPQLNAGLISATPAAFVDQMEILAQDYHVVSMQTVLRAFEGRQLLPERAVLITFDDAYVDFAEHAWPAMSKLNLPATVFVPTAYPNQPKRLFWWDKIHQVCYQSEQRQVSTPIGRISLSSDEERQMALKKLQGHVKALLHEEAMAFVDELHTQYVSECNGKVTVLSWDELRRLAKDGVTLGAHTQTHPILTRVSLEQARDEMLGSQADLRREIRDVLPIFSYPDGGHTQAVIDVLKNANFKLGFNGPSGVNDVTRVDPFRIRRINVTRKTTPFVFRLRLSPLFSGVEKFRHRKRVLEISTSSLH
ncbi:polysaccharide deacetylase family protein [bacterium]|nr:polysaccharide deacetylase family protein [bacterium]